MKFKLVINQLIAIFFVAGASHSSAGIVFTNNSAPSAGSFFTDASNSTSGDRFLVNSARSPAGQSFIHGDSGDPNWILNSVTFLGTVDTVNSTTESLAGLALRVFDGGPGGMQLGSDITFGSGTFDSSGKYITFSLTTAESADIGELESGETYSIILVNSDADGFRLDRAVGDSTYTDGQLIFNNSFNNSGDAVFFVSGTAVVPEPAVGVFLGFCGLAFFGRYRHRRFF